MWATPIACSASLAGRCPHSPTGPTTANPPTTHHHTKGGRPTRPHFHLREPFSQPPPHSHFHLLDNALRPVKPPRRPSLGSASRSGRRAGSARTGSRPASQ